MGGEEAEKARFGGGWAAEAEAAVICYHDLATCGIWAALMPEIHGRPSKAGVERTDERRFWERVGRGGGSLGLICWWMYISLSLRDFQGNHG